MAAEPQTSSELRNIRRMLRVLGALPSHTSDSTATANAAKLVHDRLRRAGQDPIWYEPAGGSPLVIAGTGPVLVVTYIDDVAPDTNQQTEMPPTFIDGVVSAPGILRKAGLIAATVGATHPDNCPDATTLVIETDRYRGSLALERWLSESGRTFEAAIWEAADLPVPAPAVIHSAFGRLLMRVSTSAPLDHVPAMYGGVVADVGTSLATALAELVSPDHEVRLAGFYDTVDVPDAEGLALLAEMAAAVQAGLERLTPEPTHLSTLHLAMGVFFAPSLVVRALHTHAADPYLPNSAEAEIDIQLVPGQSADAVMAALAVHFQDRLQGLEITPLLVHPAVKGRFDLAGLRAEFDQVIPTAPGPSPAGLIESAGTPTVGYAAIGSSGDDGAGRVTLNEIEAGSRFVQALIGHLRSPAPDSDQ